jgi:hypothetical protein
VLGNPVAGFMYPAFNDRSSDYDNMYCVVKNDPEREMIRGMYAADIPDYVKPEPKKKVKADSEDGLTMEAAKQAADEEAAEGYALHMEASIKQTEGVDTSIRQNSDIEIQTRPEGFGENIETLTEKAMQEKLREEAMMEEEKEQVFEGLNNFHKDQVILPEDKIIERDVNGRKFFLVPESLIPYDKLQELLESLMQEA